MEMTGRERTLVRLLVGAALTCGALISVSIPVPLDRHGATALPAIALGQVSLYRLEVTLLVFYSEINELKRALGDSKQPEVDSKR